MNIEFATNELRVRAGSESAANRAWGAIVGRRYVQRVRLIYAARDWQVLIDIRSLRIHPLRGERAGLWSMVLHDRYRLVFSLPGTDTVRIEEVSNHYDD